MKVNRTIFLWVVFDGLHHIQCTRKNSNVPRGFKWNWKQSNCPEPLCLWLRKHFHSKKTGGSRKEKCGKIHKMVKHLGKWWKFWRTKCISIAVSFLNIFFCCIDNWRCSCCLRNRLCSSCLEGTFLGRYNLSGKWQIQRDLIKCQNKCIKSLLPTNCPCQMNTYEHTSVPCILLYSIQMKSQLCSRSTKNVVIQFVKKSFLQVSVREKHWNGFCFLHCCTFLL